MKFKNIEAPLSVCWDITNKCNSNCKFCYRFTDNLDLGSKEHDVILQKLIELGVKKISYSGGEPLLAPDLPELLRKTKNAGIITSLISNGILLPQKWDKLKEYIDWLTLPMDGSNKILYRKVTRGSSNEYNVLSSNIINAISENVNLKFNTVASKMNIDDLPNIAELIKSLRVKRWKIFHFIPIRGAAAINNNEFSISSKLFNDKIAEVVDILNNTDCRITVADHNYLQNNYFWINSDGAITVTEDYKDIVLGNALDDDLYKIWQSKHFDHEKHIRNRNWLK